VLFEPGDDCLRIDLGVATDMRKLIIVGEAKVSPDQPEDLASRLTQRYATDPAGWPPHGGSMKSREGEARTLALRLWTIRPPYLWLVAPGVRRAYRCSYAPLELEPLPDLPAAAQLGLKDRPARPLKMPRYY
jgi:hypothetical protein